MNCLVVSQVSFFALRAVSSFRFQSFRVIAPFPVSPEGGKPLSTFYFPLYTLYTLSHFLAKKIPHSSLLTPHLNDEFACALACDLRFVASAIDYGRGRCAASAAVDDDVGHVAIFFLQQFGVGFVFRQFVVLDRGGHQWVAERGGDGTHNVVVGYAYADGFAVFEEFGQSVAPWQNECERAGQILFQQFECAVVDAGVFAHAAQVVADNSELRFAWVEAAETTNFFDGARLVHIATDGINGVGWVDDDASVAQYFGDVRNDFRVWIFVVESNHFVRLVVICSGYCR